MSNQVLADELENEITLMQQELIVKRMLLDESRQKLQSEITKHKETKSTLNKYENEKKELQIQLDISLKATQNLELEITKNREHLIKLQVQTDTYLNERAQLLDRCYNCEVENNQMKNEITDLKEQLKIHIAFQENYKLRQTQTESIINEIIRKQEILNKEQSNLETACKESLKFASKISEEMDFQSQFVTEAQNNQIKMEREMICLMAALKESQNKLNDRHDNDKQSLLCSYLDEWRDYKQENTARIKDLMEENTRLVEELTLATSRTDLLLSKKEKEIVH